MAIHMLDKLKQLFSGPDIPAQRRQTRRVDCWLAVEVRAGKDIQPAMIVDMGLVGLRLQIGRKLPLKSSVVITYEGYVHGGSQAVERQLNCKVLWCQEYTDYVHCGLVYADPPAHLEKSFVKPMLKHLGMDRIKDSRTKVRVPAFLKASLQVGSNRYAGMLVDLSIDGALLETSRDCATNVEGILQVTGLEKLPPFSCTVRVVRTFKTDKGTRGMGLHFPELAEAETKLLKQYLKTLLKAPRERPKEIPWDMGEPEIKYVYKKKQG